MRIKVIPNLRDLRHRILSLILVWYISYSETCESNRVNCCFMDNIVERSVVIT